MLKRGTLWSLVVERSERAVASGALQPIPTERERIEQDGVAFVVRAVASLERKRAAGREQSRAGTNPFLDYEEDLYVADLSDTHVALLNKFNVVDHHLLIVTRVFEEQQNEITFADFEALATCMAEFDGLGFYNAGEIAGASQRHKHLQLVPVPLGAGPDRTPIDAALASARFNGPLGQAPGLPFAHALARLDARADLPASAAAGRSLESYRSLLRAVGLDPRAHPYNLLVTRDWMLLVPRIRETVAGISVNALGFAGSLLVRNAQELALVRKRGPMTILREVAAQRIQ